MSVHVRANVSKTIENDGYLYMALFGGEGGGVKT